MTEFSSFIDPVLPSWYRAIFAQIYWAFPDTIRLTRLCLRGRDKVTNFHISSVLPYRKEILFFI